MGLALTFIMLACKSAPEPSAPAETDADADTDTDTDADADTDTDTDADTDTGATCSEDLLEPNDTLLTASPLATYTGLWTRIGNPDVFYFTQPPHTLLVAEVQHQWIEGDVDIYLVDSEGLAVGTSGTTVSDVERATACNAGPEPVQRYVYIEIWQSSLDACNTYDLSYTLTPNRCGVDTADTSAP